MNILSRLYQKPLNTSFINAVKKGDIEATQTLLSSVQKTNLLRSVLTTKDPEGYTPLMLAAKGGHSEITSIIIRACDRELLKDIITEHDEFGHTSLMLAAASEKTGSDVVVVRMLTFLSYHPSLLKTTLTQKDTSNHTLTDYIKNFKPLATQFIPNLTD